MVSGNTESLNYVGNDGTCDHSWLMMLLGNATLVSAALSRTHLMPSAGLSVFLLLVHILFSPPANSQRVHKRHFTSLLLHVCPLLLLFCIHRSFCTIKTHSIASCHYFLFLVHVAFIYHSNHTRVRLEAD